MKEKMCKNCRYWSWLVRTENTGFCYITYSDEVDNGNKTACSVFELNKYLVKPKRKINKEQQKEQK
jgi:hypothetical protein